MFTSLSFVVGFCIVILVQGRSIPLEPNVASDEFQELGNQIQPIQLPNHCTGMDECTNNCTLGHVKDDEGCPICDMCKRSGTMEGDIIIEENAYPYLDYLYGPVNGTENRAAQNIERRRWPKTGNCVNVGYEFTSTMSASKRRNIERAIEQYKENTCIRFESRSSQQREYIRFVENRGCSSNVGRVGVGRSQDISIGPGCDRKLGTIIHELMHALGFWHEQSRGDRDNYVTIRQNNILPGFSFNFLKQNDNWDPLGSPYDLTSVMHYGGFFFSNGNGPTIVDKSGKAVVSQRNGFSVEDIKQINRLYKCSGYSGYEENKVADRCGAVIGTTSETATTTSETTAETTSATMTTPVETTTKTSSSCKDLQEHCEFWLSQGDCTNENARYMERFCPKSCGVCVEETTTVEITTTPETTCKDQNEHCPYWERQNYCVVDFVSYMRKYCPKSCGFC